MGHISFWPKCKFIGGKKMQLSKLYKVGLYVAAEETW